MEYAIPILLLALTIAAFFGVARGKFASFGMPQFLLRILAALPLLVSGIALHFFHPRMVAAIIPRIFPARDFLAVFTGVLEVAGAIGLFVPRFRRSASFCIALMMVAILPANVYVAGKTIEGMTMPSIPIRTGIQIVYIVLVLLAGYGIPGRNSALKKS
jgi:uncharacterized membrane protein